MSYEVFTKVSAIKKVKKQEENISLLILKMAAASAISWEISKLSGSEHPYLAPLSVILCLQTTVNRSIKFSYHRMAGTIIGIAVTVLAVPNLKVNGWTIGLLMLIGCLITSWLKRDESAIHQVALTILFVFVLGHKSGDYYIDRFRDTLIGAITAVVIHMFIFPPDFTKKASENLNELVGHLLKIHLEISNWLQTGLKTEKGYSLQLEVKQLTKELNQTRIILQTASDSLKYNPLRKNSEKTLRYDKQTIYLLEKGCTYLSSIISLFMEWSAAGTITSEQLSIWANQITALKHFWETKIDPAAAEQKVGVLMVTLPKDFERAQFHVSLFHETDQLIKSLSSIPTDRALEE